MYILAIVKAFAELAELDPSTYSRLGVRVFEADEVALRLEYC